MRGGWLHLERILGLKLKGTAVLSACETAISDPRRSFDPVSLASAFLGAGCERVVASLWRVDDEATAALMASVYAGVFRDGLGWPFALQRAQVAMLSGTLAIDGRDAASMSPRSTTDPYYWAGLQCYGDGGPDPVAARVR